MAKRKIPNQAASGAETFSDFLVGRQITDGTSSLTNSVFALDKSIPEKDSKTFKTNPFSEYITLSNLKQETVSNVTTSNSSTRRRTDTVQFRTNKKRGDKSLFGSLKSRILVSLTNIIQNFPAGLQIISDRPIGSNTYSAFNITYDDSLNRTTFFVENSKIFNPFDIGFIPPLSDIAPTSMNPIRDFYSSYTNYVLDLSNQTYPVVGYTQPDNNNQIKLVVFGKPFTGTTYTPNLLIRPNDGVVEEFFGSLDDLEGALLNRDSNPIYTTSFQVPKDNEDTSKTSLITVQYSWPVSSDGWNIQIDGLDYENYVNNLSDIGDEVDDYKSNLTVRFLAAPQLFEFDTEDKKAESVFQLYGQSFDSVKKYIDNIAYMRNVSYDAVNNVPDVLLKNLAENLGLSTINLFDQKSLDEVLYSRLESNYDGVATGTNLVEAEYEFYRRLLVNLAYIYKSKGTRGSIDFFLKFLGAPEPLIRIDEYIYRVTSMPSSFDLEKDIYDVIQGQKVYTYGEFNTTAFTYNSISYTGTTSFDREGYPVDELTGLPRRAFNQTEGIFYGAGAGWYDETLSHRSPLVLDNENSVLTGRTKTIKTKNKPYTYGEDYFDVFRTLPGLDTGYGLTSEIDNSKGKPREDDPSLILNRKNIGVYISPARALDYDIYRQGRDLLIAFGSNTLYPQTGATFAEYVDNFIHKLVTNSNKIRYKKNYIQLEDVYRDYISQTGFTPYYQIDVTEFVERISPYWMQLVEQLVPSTTQWTGGNLVDNNLFGRPKYWYRLGCQPAQFIENLYPDFESAIEEDLETILGEENNFRNLINLTGVTYYPVVEIDGIKYGGPTYSGYTNSMSIVVSGTTNTTNSAKLFNVFPMTGCTSLNSGDTTNMALICDYKDYLSPDVVKIKQLWLSAIEELVSTITLTRNSAGYDDYAPYTATTGQTYYVEEIPLLYYETYIDKDGDEKILFTSVKYGPNQCSVSDYLDYRFESEYSVSKSVSGICVEVTSGDEYYCETPTGNTFVSDVYVEVIGTKTGIQSDPNGWPFYIYANCLSGYNQNADVYIERVVGEECKFKITGVSSNDVIDFNIVDAANSEVKFRIDGLQVKFVHDPCNKSHVEIFEIVGWQGTPITQISYNKGVTYCDNYTGYTLQPIVEYQSSFDYGIGCETKVLVVESGLTINSGTTVQDIVDYISGGTITEKNVCDLDVNEYILSVEHIPCSGFTFSNIQNALNNSYKFSFNYVKLKVTSKECLGSVKTSLITGLTKNDTYEVFEVLPTTQLRVYTNKIIEDFGSVTNGSYFFDDRFPEELQPKPTNFIEPCCDHPKELYKNGDFLITKYGELIEVISVDLNYCETNLYYNLNLSKNNIPLNTQFLIVLNGNNSEQILMKHKYEKHLNNGFYTGQYYTTSGCTYEPTCEELLPPVPTPSVEILINPMITENDEYISVGDNEYLKYN